MAGYRLCREKAAIRPFYIECIGTSIQSIEELCFFFYEYLPLLDATIINPVLVRWVDMELNEEEAAAAMEQALSGGINFAGFILPVFDAIGWLTDEERSAFLERINRFFALPAAKRMKLKGDALVRCGRYVAASMIYRQIIDESPARRYSSEFLSKVWHNKGVADMKMMLYDEAIDAFKKAEELEKTPQHAKAIILALGLSKPKARYDEAIGELKPSEEALAEAESLLAFVRGDSARVSLPEDLNAYVKEKVEEYHVATGA